MVIIDNNFIGKSGEEISKTLRTDLAPKIIGRLPKAALVILYGSAARGKMSEGSDVDVMVFLPRKNLTPAFAAMGELADLVWQNSSIDLAAPFPVELLYEDEVWNRDFLLHSLKEALPLYDPRNILPERQKSLAVFPEKVRQEKIIFTGHKIISWLARLQQAERRKDSLSAAAIRAKIIKLNIILLNLKDGNFWVANHLYASLANQPGIRKLADECVANIASEKADEFLGELTKVVLEKIVASGFLPKDFYASYKPWVKPLRYKISEALL